MLIKKIKLENIRSYENQEIDFPIGSTLLSGDIGSGKTSVLLAVEFALFGLQPSQRGNSLLKNGKNEGRVVLEIEIDNKSVVVERTLKRSRKTVNQEYASISIDGLKEEASVTEIKNKILKLMNYPAEFAKKTNLLYKFTVYTPQEEMKQIILESPEIRLNTLRHVFGIDKYKRIEENTDIFTSKLREEIRNKEGQITDIEQIKKNLQERNQKFLLLEKNDEEEQKALNEIKSSREKIEKEALELEKKIKEKQKLETEKEKAELMLMNKKDFLADVKNQIEKLNVEIEEGKKTEFHEKKLSEIINNIMKNKEQEKNLQEKLISYSSQLDSLEKTKKEIKELQEKISKISKCPTCLQEVNEQYKKIIFEKVEQEIVAINQQFQKITEQRRQISDSLASAREDSEILEKQKSEEEIKKIKSENLQEKIKTLAELEKKSQQINSDLHMILQHIKSLDEGILEFSKFSEIYENKKTELDEEKYKERQKEIKIAEIKKEQEMVSHQIAEIEKTIREKEKLQEKINYLKELEDWLSEKFLNLILFTEKNVMLKLREEFSKLFSEWFSVLVPETLSARLDEEFSPITEQQGYELAYSHLSGGERTAVALAYRLSLNQVINSLLSKIKTRDLVILDEPTDGFSEQQLDKMRDVLSQLKVQQLILVSHEAKIESFVENIIKFKKHDGVTKVEI